MKYSIPRLLQINPLFSACGPGNSATGTTTPANSCKVGTSAIVFCDTGSGDSGGSFSGCETGSGDSVIETMCQTGGSNPSSCGMGDGAIAGCANGSGVSGGSGS